MQQAGETHAAWASTQPLAKAKESLLDRFLAASHPLAQECLLPTPKNVHSIHLPRGLLLQLISVQDWISANLALSLPLLHGTYVLVPSALVTHDTPMQHTNAACNPACCSSSCHGSFCAAAMAEAIPWRLCQVAAVLAAPSADPADATVVLVGGDRVRAGAVGCPAIGDIPEHEYLCCELAELQQCSGVRCMRVLDAAHVLWRLRVAQQVDKWIEGQRRRLIKLQGTKVFEQQAPKVTAAVVKAVRRALKQLPQDGFVQEQVLPILELHPQVDSSNPTQPRQPLGSAKSTKVLQALATTWQQYVQHKLGQQQQQQQPHQPHQDRQLPPAPPWSPVAASGRVGCAGCPAEAGQHDQQQVGSAAAAVAAATAAMQAAGKPVPPRCTKQQKQQQEQKQQKLRAGAYQRKSLKTKTQPPHTKPSMGAPSPTPGQAPPPLAPAAAKETDEHQQQQESSGGQQHEQRGRSSSQSRSRSRDRSGGRPESKRRSSSPPSSPSSDWQHSRSRSRSRRCSRSQSKSRGTSRSKSRSRNRIKSRSRSRSRGGVRPSSRNTDQKDSSRGRSGSEWGRARSRSRDRSRDRDRSKGRTMDRSRDRDRSRSRGQNRSRSRSRGPMSPRGKRPRGGRRSRWPPPMQVPPPPPLGMPPPPSMHLRPMGFVERVFADFDAAIAARMAVSRFMGSLPLPTVVDLMPPPLYNLVYGHRDFTVPKLIHDHMLHFHVVTKGGHMGPLDFVDELRYPRPPVPACAMWNPEVGRGCPRGAACPDRHDISHVLLSLA